MTSAPRIALVAGEASGDQLGAALIQSIRHRHPDAEIFGIGGRRMRAAGFEAWWDIKELSVMGLFEVLSHLPRLLRLRRDLLSKIQAAQPDVLVGIDAPDFNLGLEKRARAEGIRTIQYVSPTVWAWRQGRARKIGASADLVLCLFPFEPDFYAGHGVSARYVGHPMADTIPLESSRREAREQLDLPLDVPVFALLPGSRASEVGRLAGPMLDAASQLVKKYRDARFIVPLPNDKVRSLFQAAQRERQAPHCQLLDGQALEAMAAADAVASASGTAALECLLVKRPMVVVYRLAGSTYWTARSLRLVKSRHISLPNLLAGEALVPELIQHDASGATIASELEHWLEHPQEVELLQKRFTELHLELRQGAADKAAEEVLRVSLGTRHES